MMNVFRDVGILFVVVRYMDTDVVVYVDVMMTTV